MDLLRAGPDLISRFTDVASAVQAATLATIMDAREAFGRCWEEVRPAVVAYLYARTGDHAVVDDLAQETALAAWRGLRARPAPARMQAWVMGIARHKLADHLRLVRSAVAIAVDAIPEASIDAAAVRVADQVNARSHALRRCIARLDPTQRELLARRYAAGEQLSAIAASLGQTDNNVKVRLHRIRVALRRCIDRALARAKERS